MECLSYRTAGLFLANASVHSDELDVEASDTPLHNAIGRCYKGVLKYTALNITEQQMQKMKGDALFSLMYKHAKYTRLTKAKSAGKPLKMHINDQKQVQMHTSALLQAGLISKTKHHLSCFVHLRCQNQICLLLFQTVAAQIRNWKCLIYL